MRCPVCKANVNELDEICPVCKTNFEDYERAKENFKEEIKKTNADFLNIMAYINIILSIIATVIIWVNFSTIEYRSGYTETNWYGVFGGIGILIAGFTLFFLLKTVVNIYDKIEG